MTDEEIHAEVDAIFLANSPPPPAYEEPLQGRQWIQPSFPRGPGEPLRYREDGTQEQVLAGRPSENVIYARASVNKGMRDIFDFDQRQRAAREAMFCLLKHFGSLVWWNALEVRDRIGRTDPITGLYSSNDEGPKLDPTQIETIRSRYIGGSGYGDLLNYHEVHGDDVRVWLGSRA